VNDAVQGYTTLASSLFERWSALATKTATKVDAGNYDAASWAEDVTAGVTLATEAGYLWVAEAFQAAATLAGVEGGGSIVTSQPFEAPAGASLELAGPLVKGPGLEQLPVSAVTIEPEHLGPDQTEFTLTVDATGYCGATYVGKVNAYTDPGTDPKAVWVWISVP
jgi:hypothetical protein